MKFKSKFFAFFLILFIFCALSAVSAIDENLTVQSNGGFDADVSDIISIDESEEDIEKLSVEDGSDENMSFDYESKLKQSDEYDEIIAEDNNSANVVIMSDEDDCELTVSDSDENNAVSMDISKKDSKLESSSDVYLKGIKTRYNSGKYFHFGWYGYFDGYFEVYKGSSLYFDKYLYGYSMDYTYNLEGMSPGKYKAKLVSYSGKTLGANWIIIQKSKSKISVKSFSAKAGSKFYCYAYVTDKYTGRNYNGGTVKFKIAGKIYKAKLKHGVAVAKIRIPSKVKKYTCKATFSGGKNVQGKSTKFRISVKPKPVYKTVRMHTKYRYLSKKVGKFTVQTFKWKGYSINGLGIFLYYNGKMLNRYKFISTVHYKYNGKWHWSKWDHGTMGAMAYHKFSTGKSVAIGDVKVKFRVR